MVLSCSIPDPAVKLNAGAPASMRKTSRRVCFPSEPFSVFWPFIRKFQFLDTLGMPLARSNFPTFGDKCLSRQHLFQISRSRRARGRTAGHAQHTSFFFRVILGNFPCSC